MNTRKVLSAVSHGSIWLNSTLLSIAVPIAIMVSSDDPVVKANAKEALNVHLNLLAAYIVFGVLCWVLVGFPLLAAAVVYNVVMPILAICAIVGDPDKPYRYPFVFRIIDSSMPPQIQPPSTPELDLTQQ